MCFSAEASFAGAAVLTTVGVFSIRKATKPSLLLFASIPVFFGIQQCAEGILWMSLPNPAYHLLSKVATTLFMLFAELFWPIIVPLSMLFMETLRRRRQVLWLLLGMGAVLILYNAYCLLFFNVTPEIMAHHIRYNIDFPRSLRLYVTLVYITVTVTPFFVSSIKRTHVLGLMVLLSLWVTYFFYRQYLISVWCFWGALMSVVIYWILRDAKIESMLAQEDNMLPV